MFFFEANPLEPQYGWFPQFLNPIESVKYIGRATW